MEVEDPNEWVATVGRPKLVEAAKQGRLGKAEAQSGGMGGLSIYQTVGGVVSHQRRGSGRDPEKAKTKITERSTHASTWASHSSKILPPPLQLHLLKLITDALNFAKWVRTKQTLPYGHFRAAFFTFTITIAITASHECQTCNFPPFPPLPLSISPLCFPYCLQPIFLF
ncbi:uncharacterized protein LOC111450506 [Cucurbita moschata]|uniref:Uncharacterized protein LOC111450506 n=1 Tax=Cucurbita moschata TaxID=3662 RepID=A0A6J1G3V0_CUCMO|nr:uncharacterized protein LOC111450506 [Cucurbita moschata]